MNPKPNILPEYMMLFISSWVHFVLTLWARPSGAYFLTTISHRLLKKIVDRVPCSEGYSHMGRFKNVRHKYRWDEYLVEIDRTSVSSYFWLDWLSFVGGGVRLFTFTRCFDVKVTIPPLWTHLLYILCYLLTHAQLPTSLFQLCYFLHSTLTE